MALTRGTERQDGREVSRMVLGAQGGKKQEGLWVLSCGVEGEALAKHRCLVVWNDPPPWTVQRRLISSSSERGSKRGAGCPLRPTSSPSYRLGIDKVP